MTVLHLKNQKRRKGSAKLQRYIRKSGKKNPDEESFRTFAEGKKFLYTASSSGRFLRMLKSTYKEESVAVYLRRGKAFVKINGKEYLAKRIVAKCFFPEFRESLSVVCKDGNELNLSLNNLRLISPYDLGKETGAKSKSQPIIFDGKRYGSVREAARCEYVSYQTILDYLNGKSKNGVLAGHKIKYVKKGRKNL